jgi:hypothetical protein
MCYRCIADKAFDLVPTAFQQRGKICQMFDMRPKGEKTGDTEAH